MQKKHSRFLINLLFLFLVAGLLSGCTLPLRTNDQPGVAEHGVLLRSGAPLASQSFTMPYAGLSGVEIFLVPDPGGPGDVTLRILDPQTGNMLAESTLKASDVSGAGFYAFTFYPLENVRSGDRLIFELVWNGDGGLRAGMAPLVNYAGGEMMLDGQVQEKQIAFRLLFSIRRALMGLLRENMDWLFQPLLAILVLILPGWGLLAWIIPGWRRLTCWERLGLSGGMGIALVPLWFLYAWALHWQAGALLLWIPLGLGILGTLASFVKEPPKFKISPGDIGLAALVLLVFFTRAWAVRGLSVPLWGDSVHHTAIAQLLIDNNGLFQSWQPYYPYQTLSVHYGFSAAAAQFSWLMGKSAPEAVVWVGQAINFLAVIAIIPLSMRVAIINGKKSRWAAAGAVVLAGFLSTLPAGYLNWGRYAQLAGQAALPVALWLVWEAVEARSALRPRWGDVGRIAAAAVSLGGMMLCYYRMPFYYGTFILAWMVAWLLPRTGKNWKRWMGALLVLLAVALVSAFSIFPWLGQVMGSSLASGLSGGEAQASQTAAIISDLDDWFQAYNQIPPLVIVLGILVFLWAIIRKAWVPASMLLWLVLLAGIKVGQFIGLPGAAMIQTFAVIITVYLPVALLSGWALADLGHHSNRWVQAGLGLLVIVGCGWGIWSSLRTIPDINQFSLLRAEDVRAVEWIKSNVPADAHFLIEGYPIYGDTSVVGSDGGWWLTLLTNRTSTIPPQYTLLAEQPEQADYSRQVVERVLGLEEYSPASVQGLDLICQSGATYIYIGHGHGLIGLDATTLFNPDDFENSPAFELVYQDGSVYIYKLIPSTCGEK